ncbi:hypothetical protein TNCV_2851681 [Trichonephila clavipes]|nr:hypothetical protein TNCV_2851681 [Trichonephila clavipes]
MSKDKNWPILNENPPWVPGATKTLLYLFLDFWPGLTVISHLYIINVVGLDMCTVASPPPVTRSGAIHIDITHRLLCQTRHYTKRTETEAELCMFKTRRRTKTFSFGVQ